MPQIRMVVTTDKGHRHARQRFMLGEAFYVDGGRTARLYEAMGVARIEAEPEPPEPMPEVKPSKPVRPPPQPAAEVPAVERPQADTTDADAAKQRRTYKRRDMTAEGSGS